MVEVSFGEWLKRQRNGRGLTQAQLAQQIGCAAITLRKIESEERRPSEQIVERLSVIFDIPQKEQTAFLHFARGDWQSAPPKESEAAPWRASTVSPRSNLPASITSLIGREGDVAVVRKYLSNVDIRLVTFIGPPGIGKTRMSIATAHEALSDFPDGVFFVALAPLEDSSLVAPTIIQTLGFAETTNQSQLERLKAGIGEKHMLLVLDNLEHIINDAASLISDILLACPRLKILTTSREALRVPGEWLYSVPGLTTPTETQLQSMDMEQVSQYAALTLFTERARAVRSDFVLNADNIQTVAAICTQLDGLPLAIELIAARIRLMSPQALLAKLNDQFVLSADGMRAVSARQKTLNNAIGWSYNLLSPEEQKLFARLSVFSGGFSLDAAETIFSRTTTNKSVSDLIASLLDKSLLQRTLNDHDEGRIIMLVTIQQFARDHLQSMGNESEVREWHFDYFLNLAETGEPHMSGHGQLEWLTRLQAERDNFRVAFEWNLARQTDTEKSLRLAAALFPFWRIRSDFHEAQHWLDIVLNLQNADHYPKAYTAALVSMGILKLMSIGAEVAEPILLQSVKQARASGDDLLLAKALDFLGLAYGFQEKFDRAQVFLEESQSLFATSNDKNGIALTHWHRGWVAEAMGNQSAALELEEQALALVEELGDVHRQSILLRAVGGHLWEAGDLNRGYIILRQALSTAYKVESKLEMGNAFFDLSVAAEQQNNLTKTVHFLVAAKKLYLASGVQSPAANADQELRRLQTQLDPLIFDTAMTQAHKWTLEQAIAYALED